jgi:hypothetical protein
MYGRSDKRYCSSTCRRDASRVRTRRIRVGRYEFVGSERAQSASVEDFLIPRLEREYGRNHRLVREARRRAEELREAELERLADVMRDFNWVREQ